MHERLFATQPSTTSFVLALAQELDIDTGPFQKCIEGGTEQIVARDVSAAQALGIKSTPSFAIGRFERDGRVRVSSLIRGAQPFATFEQAINTLLDKNALLPVDGVVRHVSTSGS